MTIKKVVFDYLKLQPLARERKNRGRTIWNIVEIMEGGNIDSISKEFFSKKFGRMNSINRWIAKYQTKYPELRGEDYEQKSKLQKKVQIELGYRQPREVISAVVNQKLI